MASKIFGLMQKVRTANFFPIIMRYHAISAPRPVPHMEWVTLGALMDGVDAMHDRAV